MSDVTKDPGSLYQPITHVRSLVRPIRDGHTIYGRRYAISTIIYRIPLGRNPNLVGPDPLCVFFFNFPVWPFFRGDQCPNKQTLAPKHGHFSLFRHWFGSQTPVLLILVRYACAQ